MPLQQRPARARPRVFRTFVRNLGHALSTSSLPRDRWLVAVLAAAAMAVAIVYGSRAIGGADEYGYVSQADLWLHGGRKIDQPFVTAVPWPRAALSFSPLGYWPDPLDDRRLVPLYAPGLPMLLAAAKAVGGQTAMFLVVPLFTALLVLGTYGIGRRLGSGSVGLIGAWLVATSPVVLFMSMNTMTDVPVAAVWAASFYFLLDRGPVSAALAGLLAGLAVLIRPNLVPLAAVLECRYFLQMREPSRRRDAVRSTVVFGLAALPGIIIVALVNRHFYGSPLESGYGNVRELFSRSNVPTNLRQYLGWLIEAHTPAVLLGAFAVFVPLRRFWPSTSDRAVFGVMAAFVVGLWGIYCAWKVFDSWFFCRFLLSSWPFMMLGTAAVAMWMARLKPGVATPIVAAAVIALGIVQVRFAMNHSAFEIGWNTRRYSTTARLVRLTTERNSVVLALNHSGSIRYYAGRTTMNIANFEGRLDQIVDWLADHEVHTYAVLEDWEVPEFESKFAGARHLAALSRPIGIFEDPGKVVVFDLTGSRRISEPTVIRGLDAGWRAPGPASAPRLILEE